MTKSIRIGALLLLLLGIAGITGAPVHSALAATPLTVTDCSSEYGTGGTSASPASGSLAWAVNQADTDNAGDTITFSCSNTITISSTLTISGSMTIDGSGQNVVLDGSRNVQLFVVTAGTALNLTGITLTNGHDSVSGLNGGANSNGGAIHNNGALSLTQDTFNANSSYYDGGAIYNATGGTLTVTASTFAGTATIVPNAATGDGGAIFNASGGTATIANSIFNSNVAQGNGGAIDNLGTLAITNSTLGSGPNAGNHAGNAGGAIANESESGKLTVTNSYFSLNQAQQGGALALAGYAGQSITNSTIYDNEATNGFGGGIDSDVPFTLSNSTIIANSAWQYGGGISTSGGDTIGGTIITGNCYGLITVRTCTGEPANCFVIGAGSMIDAGYNEVTGNEDCSLSGSTGDTLAIPALVGSAPTNNGGPTLTWGTTSTSPGIDAIPPGNALCPATDQRGFIRPAGAGCDIGAYEYDGGQSIGCPTFSSLSTAIASARAQGNNVFILTCNTPTPPIKFDGTLTINKNITFDARTSPQPITFDGAGSVQLFTVNAGSSFGLKGLTLSNGFAPSSNAGGGAVRNNGTLTITDSTLAGNSATAGGAIRSSGPLTVTNSTFSGNTAVTSGGALYTVSQTTVTSSTFAGNSAGTSGGALNANNSQISVAGTIIASSSGGNCSGTVTDSGYNLEWTGSTDTSTGYTCGFSSAKGDQVGSDPLLGALANNGGPTQTMGLGALSPAINAVPSANCPSTDQRGVTRLTGGDAKCDIGAYDTVTPSNTTPSDTTPPTVTVTTTPASVPGGQGGSFNATDLSTNSGAITVTVSATDDSGVTNLSCTDAVNGGSAGAVTVGSQSGSSPRTGSFSLSTDGTHAVTCQATDGASNTGAASGSTNTATVKIDGTAPTSTIQCNLLTCSGLYSGSVSVSLGALDNSNGSGVEKIVYTTDGTTPDATNGTVYSGAFTVSSDTTVTYAAIDNAGNVEAANTQTISFLVPTGLTVSAASGIYGGSADLSATLSPAVAGKSVTFSLNGTAVCGPSMSTPCPTTNSSGTASLIGVSLSGINAGTYPGSGSCDATTGVSAGFDGGTGQYGSSSGCNTLTVAQKDLHVTAVHSAINYGAAPPSSYGLSYDSSDFVAGDDPSVVTGTPDCSTDYTQGSNVGSYAITCAIGTLSVTNYHLVSGDSGTGSTSGTALSSTAIRLGTLEVDRASPSFSFDLSGLPAKTYGDVSFSVASEATSSVGTISFSTDSGSTGCTVGADGTVHITGATSGTNTCVVEASLTTGSSNYSTPDPIDQGFSIASKAITLQASSPADQTFGSTTSPTVSCTPTGFLNGDGFGSGNAPSGGVYASASDTTPMTVTATTGAGTFVTECSGGDPGSNYTITTRNNGSFTIDKKPIQVTASHTDVTYGDTAPSSYTISYSTGWVSPDTQTSIVGTDGPSCTAAYTSSSTVSGGPYPISCTIGSLTADNYTFVSGYADSNQGQPLASTAPGFQLGQLGVTKADQTISFTSTAPASAIYGDTYTPTASSDSGLTVTLGASGACSHGSNTVTMTGVGSCTVTADQPGNGNVNAATQKTQVFSVDKKSVHVTASAGPLTYGAAKPTSYTATYTSGDFVLDDSATTSSITGSLSCSTTYTATSDVGIYPISCNSSLASPHYTFESGYSDTTYEAALPGSTDTAIRLGTLTVNQAQGSVSINNIPATPMYGGSFTPTYTTNSTGATSTTSQTPSVCAVGSDGTVSYGATGTCTLVAHVAGDTNHTAADGSPQSFTINPAIGNAAYIGQTLFVTSGSNSTAAQVTLSASVEGSAGDITTAKVSFIDQLTGQVLAKGVPVSPVAGATTPTGTANTTVTLSSGKYGAQSYLIEVVLDPAAGSEYSNADQLGDPTAKAYATLTVMIPATTNSMQGTAAITPSGAAAGTYGAGTNVHYTAGLTYNKSGTNPQGQILLSLDLGGSTYVIKSNSISSMACTVKATPCTDLTVYTKASISRIDASGTTTSVDGNVTLRMDVHDGGTSGDTIGFTILSSKTSSLYYSNNWVNDSRAKAWRTVPQTVSNTGGTAVVIN